MCSSSSSKNTKCKIESFSGRFASCYCYVFKILCVVAKVL